MRIVTMRSVSIVILVTAFASVAFSETSPLRFGTWTLNVARSKFDPGPPPMSQIRKEERSGDAMKASVEGIDATGGRIAYSSTVRSDGKDYPLTGTGVPYGSDTIAFVEIDPFTIDATFRKAGIITGTAHSVLSPDGRTLTVVSKGKNAKGQATNNVTVWEKR
jgi:hypothetical protein